MHILQSYKVLILKQILSCRFHILNIHFIDTSKGTRLKQNDCIVVLLGNWFVILDTFDSDKI